MTTLPKTVELNSEELDRVSGGIIIVSGYQHRFELSRRTSLLDRVALNPQPLPPKILFGH
jgi:hypothetical protein